MNKLTLNVETLRVLGGADLAEVQGGRHHKKSTQDYLQCGTGSQSIVIACPVNTIYAQCGTGANSLVKC